MSKGSLKRQFLTNSAAVTVVVMLVSLLLVDWSFRNELESSFKERLRLHIYGLLSLSQHQGNILSLPLVMTNPRFNDMESGLWAVVVNENREILWQSLSLIQANVDVDDHQQTGDWKFSTLSIEEVNYLALSYKVAWAIGDEVHHYHFVVAENLAIYDNELQLFRIRLFAGFLLTTLSLLLIQNLVLRRTFKPIGELAQEIDAMESGKQSAIQGKYPEELEVVTSNLNALIVKEDKQRQKYRESMADLAHSIKTPLSVIRAAIDSKVNTDHLEQRALDGAIERIDQTVEYQLRRAVISGHALLSRGASVKSALDDMLLVLNHAYEDKNLCLDQHVADDIFFAGDENDLLELFGNLLDNAYKYAASCVRVSASLNQIGLVIEIEDDGAGVPLEQIEAITKRGARMDSQGLGQGIGLAVVVNIVNSYEGRLEVGESSMGGASFRIVFPSQKAMK